MTAQQCMQIDAHHAALSEMHALLKQLNVYDSLHRPLQMQQSHSGLHAAEFAKCTDDFTIAADLLQCLCSMPTGAFRLIDQARCKEMHADEQCWTTRLWKDIHELHE